MPERHLIAVKSQAESVPNGAMLMRVQARTSTNIGVHLFLADLHPSTAQDRYLET